MKYLFQGAGYVLPVSKVVSQKARDLVTEGVHNVKEIERHLKTFVVDDLFAGLTPPDRGNRHFYPTSEAIYNIVYSELAKSRYDFYS